MDSLHKIDSKTNNTFICSNAVKQNYTDSYIHVDAKEFGGLEFISALRFENNLQKVKTK